MDLLLKLTHMSLGASAFEKWSVFVLRRFHAICLAVAVALTS